MNIGQNMFMSVYMQVMCTNKGVWPTFVCAFACDNVLYMDHLIFSLWIVMMSLVTTN